MLYSKIGKPLFFRMDPEKAHHLVIDGLSTAGKIPGIPSLTRGMYGVAECKELAVDLFGLHFPNPIGLAAGLDKNAKAVDMFANIGLGFAEVGTVTPKGQAGNELPRLFRLPPDEALINRMGFNNEGADAMVERLAAGKKRSIPVAVNIGKNKVTPNELAHEDYRACLQKLYKYGDFFVVNISSPNTPDLRALQHGDELRLLLRTVMEEMNAQSGIHGGARKPVLVKIAPDMTDEQLGYTVDTIAQSGVSGIIATNTTLSREGLTHSSAGEMGGLSGKPLKERTTEVIRAVYRQTGGKLPIIGSGGIFSADDAYDKIRAGASLVEIYTALIYKGPELLREMAQGLKERLRRDGLRHITEAIGADHRK
ncbi:quinone-dependent dihydroorotate dehydrogenase [Paenibacillus oenotherae]|uniref:Dihydroorotate dehydrogenase (quinone) n=1 Tax=Paenibacillus oenotherae TaxID=1435645 RepID=A0ABS7DDI1_9BACL|nr:quinone-dependent dihydroorotate dehydrogenase [Paenibacillus oenotherae]MBW7477711.1 quinone-dependent dihydroorotate dehydrogenase [Paenibacillus oenotherae]